MKNQTFQLFPVIKTNFLLVCIVITAGLVLFSLIANKTFPFQAISLLILVIPALRSQTKNIAEIKNDFLYISSDQLKVPGTWKLSELHTLGAKKLDTDSSEIPVALKPTFLSNNTNRKFGFGKSKDGQDVFHFVSRNDVPLVFIPLKAGGHILLSLKQPDLFLTALLSSTLDSLESA